MINACVTHTKLIQETISEEKDINYIKNLKNIISSLENHQLIEIVKILDKYNFKYTQNNNGIFINMCKLDNNIIDSIKKYLIFIKKI